MYGIHTNMTARRRNGHSPEIYANKGCKRGGKKFTSPPNSMATLVRANPNYLQNNATLAPNPCTPKKANNPTISPSLDVYNNIARLTDPGRKEKRTEVQSFCLPTCLHYTLSSS
jgi:hypothetical protein